MGKKISKCLGIVLGVTVFCIILHIFLPEDVTSDSFEFDSKLVKTIGFPAVMSIYFFIFFLQLYITFAYLLNKSKRLPKNSAIRLAIGYALIPFLGMLEIVPDSQWTLKVSFYQIFVGLGDALPVPLLILLIYQFCIEKNRDKKNTYIKSHLQRKSKYMLAFTVAAVFIIERIICYSTGITLSAMKEYPIPCMIWTIGFGIVLGIVCTILYPIYDSIGNNKKQSVMLMILTLGLNWIWFNNFIAMIAKDMVLQMTTRSCIDVAVIICCIIAMKGKMRCEEV